MAVVISQKHLSLNKKLAKEVNKLSRNFNYKSYLKIESSDNWIFKRDISVEKKKAILMKKLHESIVKTFSIKKDKFSKKALDLLKIKLHNTRKIINKLRSINYYLETTFLEELKLPKVKIKAKSQRLQRQDDLARDELEALEYTAYKLIGEVVMLDKKVLQGYSKKERNIAKKEKIAVSDLGFILRKETQALEHLEAKLPPPKAASTTLLKEPVFTHWASRVFALLSYLEHNYSKERMVFSKLKKNKATRMKINRKILQLIKEKANLLKLMQEKVTSMKRFRIGNKIRAEVHNLTTTIGL